MNPKIEFLIYVTIYLFVFYGLWVTVYEGSHKPENLKKLLSLNLVDKREFTPLLRLGSEKVMQDVAVQNEWTNLLNFIVYSSWLVIYLPISLFGSLFSQKVHQILRILSSASLITLLLGSYVSLDIIVMTTIFFSLGWVFRGYSILIWAVGVVTMYYSNELLEKTVYKQLSIFDLPTLYTVFPSIYSTHFMSLVRAISLALFLCDIPSSSLSSNTDHGRENSNNNMGFTQATTTTTTTMDKGGQMELQPALWERFLDALDYAFYLPTVFFGPLIVYADWDSFIHKKTPTRFVKPLGRIRKLTVARLVGRGLRLLGAAAFWSALVCMLYPKAILTYPNRANWDRSAFADENPWSARGIQVPPWTVWSCLNLAGIGFYFFHLLLYGIPGLLADTEQLATETLHRWWWRFARTGQRAPAEEKGSEGQLCLVPAPPSCVFHITLYSEMWRTFDRGLYNFMFCHIYLPLLGDQAKPEPRSWWYSTVRSVRHFCASSLPFFFVLLFHTVNLHNAIWIFMNMLQFYVERLIRWCDRNTRIGLKLREEAWVNWRHRLLAALHSLSVLTSLSGLIFFLFEYTVGMAFFKHVVFSYGSLVQFIGLYGLYFANKYRENWFTYRGLPAGFSDPPRKKED